MPIEFYYITISAVAGVVCGLTAFQIIKGPIAFLLTSTTLVSVLVIFVGQSFNLSWPEMLATTGVILAAVKGIHSIFFFHAADVDGRFVVNTNDDGSKFRLIVNTDMDEIMTKNHIVFKVEHE